MSCSHHENGGNTSHRHQRGIHFDHQRGRDERIVRPIKSPRSPRARRPGGIAPAVCRGIRRPQARRCRRRRRRRISGAIGGAVGTALRAGRRDREQAGKRGDGTLTLSIGCEKNGGRADLCRDGGGLGGGCQPKQRRRAMRSLRQSWAAPATMPATVLATMLATVEASPMAIVQTSTLRDK